MKNIFLIGKSTFSEALRQKLILLIALAAILLVLSSNYLLKLDLGGEKLKFVFDFGSGAAEFFGAIVAIVATSQMFHSEIDNRTIMTLMSKPVSFWQFVAGKLLGAFVALGLFIFVIALATTLMLLFTQVEIENSARGLAGQKPCNFAGVWTFSILQWVKLCAVASITAAVCSFSRSLLFSVVVSFMILAISIMGAATLSFGGEKTAIMKFASDIFPDFQIFKVSEAFAFDSIDLSVVGALIAYAVIYSLCCCALAAWSFSRREF